MGTTVVGAWIHEQIAGVAHVGDSRAYLWHDDRLEPLTRDHSLMEAHIEAGLADEGRSLPVEQQNVLVRVLGREPAVEVDVTEVPVRSGDYVLLCSDGLTRMVPEAELAKAIRTFQDPQQICDHLIAAANRNGGADNITVVVVEVTGGWWHQLIMGSGSFEEEMTPSPVDEGRMSKLTLQYEGIVLKEYAIGPGITIGRLPDNAVIIDNPAVSGHHARVFHEGTPRDPRGPAKHERDVRQRPPVTRHVLQHGDEVLVGKHSIVFDRNAVEPQPCRSSAAKPRRHRLSRHQATSGVSCNTRIRHVPTPPSR